MQDIHRVRNLLLQRWSVCGYAYPLEACQRQVTNACGWRCCRSQHSRVKLSPAPELQAPQH